jgi:hypothetical protein
MSVQLVHELEQLRRTTRRAAIVQAAATIQAQSRLGDGSGAWTGPLTAREAVQHAADLWDAADKGNR